MLITLLEDAACLASVGAALIAKLDKGLQKLASALARVDVRDAVVSVGGRTSSDNGVRGNHEITDEVAPPSNGVEDAVPAGAARGPVAPMAVTPVEARGGPV
jgi:hypothetical protein